MVITDSRSQGKLIMRGHIPQKTSGLDYLSVQPYQDALACAAKSSDFSLL